MVRRVLCLVVGLALLAACSSDPGGTRSPSAAASGADASSAAAVSSPVSSRVRPALDGVPLTPCRIGGGSFPAVCGTFSVPEDRTAVAGRMIDLRVAVIPSSSATPEPDPFFMLAGGPGAAATDSLAWAAHTYHGIHASRDIVLVDQRGTGGSNRLAVGPSPDVTGQTEAEAEATIRAWVDEQLRELPGDPRFYTTSVAMDDLDDVRVALGYDEINLYGGSYGATAAQYYIRQHEQHLRTVVLDGATLLDVPVFELIAANSQRALDRVLARCAEDAACAEVFPELPGDLQRAMELLADEPVATDISNPVTGEPFVMDQATLASAIHGALLGADTAAGIPMLIHGAAEGRWNEVASRIIGASGGGMPEGDVPVMSAVIRCSEAWAAFDPARVERTGAGSYLVELQLEAARDQVETCRFAPDGIVPENDAEPARSDVPVLLLVGENDPQDPPDNIATARETLLNSLTVVAPAQGHTVAHLGCLPSVVDSFVAAGSVDGLDASCVAERVPVPPFHLP